METLYAVIGDMKLFSALAQSSCLVALSISSLACQGVIEPLVNADPELLAFVNLANDHRASIGCPRLAWNSRVAAVAQQHSEDMVRRDFFAHTNPDGESPFDRLRAAHVTSQGAAENIASGYRTGEAVFEGWMNSSGHRANLENCAMEEHGVGLYQRRWTHVFIRPANN